MWSLNQAPPHLGLDKPAKPCYTVFTVEKVKLVVRPHNLHLKPKPPSRTFVFKAVWHATSLLIKVDAEDEEEAFDKAAKRRDTRGCLNLIQLSERK